MDLRDFILLLFSIFCFVSAFFTYKKGHPFTLLALVIFNCGLFCFFFSYLTYTILPSIYIYSSLLFPLGFLVFFRNLHTKKINRLDRVFLGVSMIEVIINLILLVIYLFFRDYFFKPESILTFCKPIFGTAYSLEDISSRPFMIFRFVITIYFFGLVILIFPFTLYKIFQELIAARKRHLNFFTADSFHFYQWSHFLFSLILISYLSVGSLMFYHLFINRIPGFLGAISYGVVGLAGIGLGIFAYVSPEKFNREIDFPRLLTHLETKKSISKTANKYENYKLELETLLTKGKIYRDPNLNLARLAEKMNISTRHLSRIINQGYNKGFSDFINSYRVEEVKINLVAPQYQHYAILSIGLEAGFNSKSSFYSIFKKMTGKNPLKYREEKSN